MSGSASGTGSVDSSHHRKSSADVATTSSEHSFQTSPILPGSLVERHGNRVHPFTRKEAPYPLNYDRIALDYDVWDNIFWRDMRGGSITLHDFGGNPPPLTLDLGCGSGAWILEAARAWPDSKFVGIDLVPIQIDVHRVSPEVAPRVEWVQGNILFKLPFPDNHFDFVRMCRVAMGIPENRWEFVISEAVRVMKPGGIFEMFEENLNFPCGEEFLVPSSPTHRPRPLSIDSIRTKAGSPAFRRTSASFSNRKRDPRDHSLLQQAYEAMLSERFINITPLSILPYYLSLHLQNLQLHTPVEFLLPPRSRSRFAAAAPLKASTRPNSPSVGRMADRRRTPEMGAGSIRMDMARAPISNNRFSAIYSEKSFSLQFEQRAVHMHLSIACFRILGCKEQIWRQFKKLNPMSNREHFDELMMDYELDMADRVAMSNTIHKNLHWPKPEMQPPAQLKYWMSELLKAEAKDGREREAKVSRTVRAFVGWK